MKRQYYAAVWDALTDMADFDAAIYQSDNGNYRALTFRPFGWECVTQFVDPDHYGVEDTDDFEGVEDFVDHCMEVFE